MKAWLSTTPVEGERYAATQRSSGSSARASAAVSGCRSVTPFASACCRIACSFGSWFSAVATSSLPQRRYGIPRSSQ